MYHEKSQSWSNEAFHLTAAYKYNIITQRICFVASCILLFLPCMLLPSWLYSPAGVFIFLMQHAKLSFI